MSLNCSCECFCSRDVLDDVLVYKRDAVAAVIERVVSIMDEECWSQERKRARHSAGRHGGGSRERVGS